MAVEGQVDHDQESGEQADAPEDRRACQLGLRPAEQDLCHWVDAII